MRVAFVLLLCSLACGCGPCGQNDDNKLERYVDALIDDSGSLGDDAMRALEARGREAIVILETGLYRAEPDGRRRIVKTLVRIGHRDAAPILAHLAEHDADNDVRDAASRGLSKLNSKPSEESKSR